MEGVRKKPRNKTWKTMLVIENHHAITVLAVGEGCADRFVCKLGDCPTVFQAQGVFVATLLEFPLAGECNVGGDAPHPEARLLARRWGSHWGPDFVMRKKKGEKT